MAENIKNMKLLTQVNACGLNDIELTLTLLYKKGQCTIGSKCNSDIVKGWWLCNCFKHIFSQHLNRTFVNQLVFIP